MKGRELRRTLLAIRREVERAHRAAWGTLRSFEGIPAKYGGQAEERIGAACNALQAAYERLNEATARSLEDGREGYDWHHEVARRDP